MFSSGFKSAAGQGKVLTRHVVMLSGSFVVVFVPSEFVTLNVSFTPVDPLAANVVAVPPVPLNPDSRNRRDFRVRVVHKKELIAIVVIAGQCWPPWSRRAERRIWAKMSWRRSQCR